MTIELTPIYRKRTEESLADTKKHLAKELSYRLDLQKADMVAFYKGHIKRLNEALETGFLIVKI